MVTQLFHDNADFSRFEARLRAMGVKTPIVPGRLPIQSFAQIKKIPTLSSTKIPTAHHGELNRAGDDEAKTHEIGIRWTIEQCRKLLVHRAPGTHFHALNKAAHMLRSLVGFSGPCYTALNGAPHRTRTV